MPKVKNQKPLVSVVIITYNSSKYVLETLESAKAQTYQNIELIVSDDCSTDDTVEKCREWIIMVMSMTAVASVTCRTNFVGIPLNTYTLGMTASRLA
jgi:alpha-1,3-rhamnosyltransferase